MTPRPRTRRPGTSLLEAWVGLGILAVGDEPSVPVWVDPMGFVARGTPTQFVGDSGQTSIPRVNLNVCANAIDPKKMALRFCSQLDGLSFDDDGRVVVGADMRELRYNW